MSLERVGGFTGFDITCDICGESEYLDFGWDNFQGAIAEAKARGWKAYKDEDDEWCHKCQTCQIKEVSDGNRKI